MARSLRFTVEREPIALEIGGDQFTAPALLAPAVLADLLDRQRVINDAMATVGAQAEAGERGAIDAILRIMVRPPAGDGAAAQADEAGIFDLILGEEDARRFATRLYSRDSYDLIREVMPAVKALIEEYTGRPTPPSSPSSNGSSDGGTSSTDGAPPEASTPSPSTAGDSST